MKRVYLDFDDVLAETFRELARFAREAFGRTPPPGKSVHFDLHESLGLADAEYGVFMERFHAERLRAVDEIPGATAALRGWVRDGAAEPVVVTGRPVSSHADSVAWLEDRGLPGVPVLHVDKYARFPDPAAPGVVPFPAPSRRCPSVVFERPWHRAWAAPQDGAPPLARLADWPALDALVRGLP